MSVWSVDGTVIKKDGKAQFLSGVCYSPTPAGAATFKPGIGDWFAPPWNGIWERDFPRMKKMGINNIRTYFFWAWTPPDDMRNWKSVVTSPVEFDHTPFLDCAEKNGISVTIGIALDGGNIFDNGDPSLGDDYLSFYSSTVSKLAELYGKHPAVMGFCIGNEQNNPSRIVRADFWDGLENIAKGVRTNAPDKLVMLAMQNDNPNMFTAKIKTGSGAKISVPNRFARIFDVWGINIYAGMSNTLKNYKEYVADKTMFSRPLIVSEWGVPGGTNVPKGEAGPPVGKATARELTADEFKAEINGKMNQDGMAMKANRSFVAGAQYFEWTDEWWKNSATPVYTQDASPDPNWPEEWWGLNSIAPADRTAKEGPWDSKNNKPFSPDNLSARPTLAALSKIYAYLSKTGKRKRRTLKLSDRMRKTQI